MGSRREVDEGRVPPEPAGGDERELVRAFTDLHRQDQFTPAPRPVAPLRGRRRPERGVIEAQVVEAAPIANSEVEATNGLVDATNGVVDTAPGQPTSPRSGVPPDDESDRAPDRRDHEIPRRSRGVDATADAGRRGLAGTAERRLSDVLALAGASGALVVPWPWFLAVAGSCLVIGAARSVAAGRRSIAVGIVDLPGRAARRVARLLRPGSLARLPVITAKTILTAIVLPAAVAAAVWVADHGFDGVVAAARLAAWQLGPRVLAAVLCLMMLAGVGETRARRAARLRRATAWWPDAGVVAVAGSALALALLVVAMAPRVPGGVLSGRDGLAWVPTPLRPAVDGVRDDVVAAELRALRSCLTEQQGIVWSVDYSTDGLDAPDIARLAVGRGDDPGPGALVTAALAADNQLAPWVEVVEIAVGDAVVLELDREALRHHGVRVDPATLGPGIVSGGGVAVAGAARVDHRVALVCSAGPVL